MNMRDRETEREKVFYSLKLINDNPYELEINVWFLFKPSGWFEYLQKDNEKL